MSQSKKIFIPAAIEFVDIAGLVKGASAGEGPGLDEFLSHIREVNAIVQVVRCFENADIHHVSGDVDPVRDIEIINTELILADLAAVRETGGSRAERRRARATKRPEGGSVPAAEKLIPHLDAGKPALTLTLSEEEQKR